MLEGKVTSVKGQIIEVEFLEETPRIYDVLIAKDDKSCKMEVYTSASPTSFYCLALTNVTQLHYGSIVYSTGEPIKFRSAKRCLGESWTRSEIRKTARAR